MIEIDTNRSLQLIYTGLLAFKHDSNTEYSGHYSLFGDNSLWFVP